MALEASDIGSDAWSARGRSVAKLRFQQEVADRRAARGKTRKQAKKWVSNPYHGPLTIAHEGPDLVIRHHEIINPAGKFAHESVPGRTITKRDFSAYFQPGDRISIRAASGYGDEGEYGIWQWDGRDLRAFDVVRVLPGTSWWKAYPTSVRPIRARLIGGTFTLSATQRR
jgi:hypothetical protein